MRLEELELIEKIQRLPLDELKEVSKFVEERLKLLEIPKEPHTTLEGILARPGFSVSTEDINQARQEMWVNFPRDFPKENQ